MKTDEGWTTRMKRGTTASPQTYHHPNAVRPDDGRTLWGLECFKQIFAEHWARFNTPIRVTKRRTMMAW